MPHHFGGSDNDILDHKPVKDVWLDVGNPGFKLLEVCAFFISVKNCERGLEAIIQHLDELTKLLRKFSAGG